MLKNKRGQNTLEYALIIAVVIAALLTINTYLKKGVQGRLKESTDQIGKQFDPENFTTASQTEGSGETVTDEIRDVKTGTTTSTITKAETVTKSDYEQWGKDAAQHY